MFRKKVTRGQYGGNALRSIVRIFVVSSNDHLRRQRPFVFHLCPRNMSDRPIAYPPIDPLGISRDARLQWTLHVHFEELRDLPARFVAVASPVRSRVEDHRHSVAHEQEADVNHLVIKQIALGVVVSRIGSENAAQLILLQNHRVDAAKREFRLDCRCECGLARCG